MIASRKKLESLVQVIEYQIFASFFCLKPKETKFIAESLANQVTSKQNLPNLAASLRPEAHWLVQVYKYGKNFCY
jgi:hypothetical protein